MKKDMDVDVAKEEEGEVEEAIITTFIIMKGVINPLEVVEEEEVAILIEQIKRGMIIFLRSVESMLKKRSILLVTKKKVKSQHYC
ncbi:hypothetical protein CR513_59504, partial [Mucuna pruriens]